MKDYYHLIIKLSLQQCLENDYSDKVRVANHNASIKKILKLQKELSDFDCSQIMKDLLGYPDSSVQLNASCICIEIGALPEIAKKTLYELSINALDATIRHFAFYFLKSKNLL